MMWQGHGEHHVWCLWALKTLLWTFIDLIQCWYGVQITSIRDMKTSDKSCELMSFHDTGHNFGSPVPPLYICLPKKVKINPVFNCTVFSSSGGSRISPGGGANSPGGGRQHTIWPNFPENCMKSKEFGRSGGGGGAPCAPPKSATV